MEQHPHSGGDSQEVAAAEQPITDEQRIQHGIIDALQGDRPIDHATARTIAAQLHGGQASPLYALASSGAVAEGLASELDSWQRDDTPTELLPWLDALDIYVTSRTESPEPVEGWSELWAADPPCESTDVGSPCATTETRQLNEAGVRQLGDIALVGAGSAPDVEPAEDDDFPWTDAAEWNASDAARDSLTEPRYSEEQMTELFSLEPDDQVGSVWQLGWHGLLRHYDRPGGLILITDTHGFRHVREADDNESLERQWATVRTECEAYEFQRESYQLAVEDGEHTASGLNPQIWVGSLADYNNGHLHGVWMDATLDPEELTAAAQFMLRNGYTSGAEEWAIMDSQDFGGYSVEEYADFRTVSLIAKGVAQHGPAYVKWVEHVGERSEDLLTSDRFYDHYQGVFDSAEAFVEYYLSETEGYDFMQFVPDSLQAYVKVDLEMYVRDWQSEGLLVEELDSGKVAVFLTNV